MLAAGPLLRSGLSVGHVEPTRRRPVPTRLDARTRTIRFRYDLQTDRAAPSRYGLLPRWEGVPRAPAPTGTARHGPTTGRASINGHYRAGGFTHTEMDKVPTRDEDPSQYRPIPLRVALFGGIAFPTQSKNDVNALGTYPRGLRPRRLSFNIGAGSPSRRAYLSSTAEPRHRPRSFALRRTIRATTSRIPVDERRSPSPCPSIPNVFKAIGEINRVHYDGGDTQPRRLFRGARSAAASPSATRDSRPPAPSASNDRPLGQVRLARPASIGGPRPGRLSASRPSSPRRPARRAAAGKPSLRPPDRARPACPRARARRGARDGSSRARRRDRSRPRVPATSTTDEILYDAAKSRLTNIAKAILDGVALRLKNNLAATCAVSASTDAKGEGRRSRGAREGPRRGREATTS
jgi:outer membrane protein OmpA-like peptidoglycan-associated protein